MTDVTRRRSSARGRRHLAAVTGGERTLVVTPADVVERLLPQATRTAQA